MITLNNLHFFQTNLFIDRPVKNLKLKYRIYKWPYRALEYRVVQFLAHRQCIHLKTQYRDYFFSELCNSLVIQVLPSLEVLVLCSHLLESIKMWIWKGSRHKAAGGSKVGLSIICALLLVLMQLLLILVLQCIILNISTTGHHGIFPLSNNTVQESWLLYKCAILPHGKHPIIYASAKNMCTCNITDKNLTQHFPSYWFMNITFHVNSWHSNAIPSCAQKNLLLHYYFKSWATFSWIRNLTLKYLCR